MSGNDAGETTQDEAAEGFAGIFAVLMLIILFGGQFV
jgi:hypothetical protein